MKQPNVNETPEEQNTERVVRIALWKVVLSVLGIVAMSSLGTVWATVSVYNTVPFRVTAAEQQILDMKKSFMPLDLATEKWKNNDTQHADIIRRLETMQVSIDKLK